MLFKKVNTLQIVLFVKKAHPSLHIKWWYALFILPFLLIHYSAGSQTANFQIITNSATNCPPLTATFKDSSYGKTVTNWSWNLGQGTVPQDISAVSNQYNTSGTYPITLTVTFDDGSKQTITKNLIVNPIPSAAFSAVQRTGCSPLSVQFYDSSYTATGSIAGWYWKLNNQVYNNQNPVAVFNNLNNYDISLYVTNNWGCKSTVADSIGFIRVIAQPVISFTASPVISCKDSATVTFVNNSTNTSNFNWNFGDNTSSSVPNPPAHFYTSSPGNYTIVLTTTVPQYCQPASQSVAVTIGKPTISISPFTDTVCSNNPIIFSGTVTPANNNMDWYFENSAFPVTGNNVQFSFTKPGKENIVVVANNSLGCTDTAKSSIFVNPAPQPIFTLDASKSCTIPFKVQPANNTRGSNLAYTWDFGDNTPIVSGLNPAHTYTGYGTFSITLTAKDTTQPGSCSGTFIMADSIQIYSPISYLNYQLSSACNPPVTASFSTSTFGFTHKPTSFTWNFGDSTAPVTTKTGTISHIFNAGGTDTASVIISGDNGCSVKNTTIISIADTCNFQPIITRSCTPCNVITIQDTVAASKVTYIDFGDGVSLNNNIPTSITHTYPDTIKNYTLHLSRIDTAGKTTHSTFTVNIVCITAGFSTLKDSICINATDSFKLTGIDSTGLNAINRIIWNFGDGSQLFNQDSVSHSYHNYSTFPVTVTYIDIVGCQEVSPPQNVYVSGPHAAYSVSPHTTCDSALNVLFKDSSALNNNIPIVKWIWNFGDGTVNDTILNNTSFNYAYKGTGIPETVYQPVLTVIDSAGCSGSSPNTYQVIFYHPKALFSSPDTVHCGSGNVTIYNYSNAVAPTYTWNLGDGSTSQNSFIQHPYLTDGAYTIKLVVKDFNGCLDSMTKINYINSVTPVARMIISDTANCWPNIILFSDSSDYAYNYTWNFGDGSLPKNTKSSQYYYSKPGTYTVKLLVTGPDGCTAATQQMVHVKGAFGIVQIDTPYHGCLPDTIRMRITNPYNITSYSWNFKDGTTDYGISDSVITHVYKESGIYQPGIIFTSPDGCSTGDSASVSIIVDSAKAMFTISPDSVCVNAGITLNNISMKPSFSSLTSQWNLGDGRQSNVVNPPVFNYPTGNNYTVSLTVHSTYGCISNFNKIIKVYSQPTIQLSELQQICLNSNAVFNAVISSEDSISTVNWLQNGVSKSNTDSVHLNFNQTGLIPVEFKLSTLHGCTIDTANTITVHPLPIPNAVPDTSICIDKTALLRAYNGVAYTWSPASSLTNPNSQFTIANPKVGITTYFVTVTDSLGCINSDSVHIEKDDSIFLSPVKSGEICQEDSFHVSATSDAPKFLWSPATGISDPTVLAPSFSPGASTAYILVAYSNNACPNKSADVYVKVDPLPTVKIVPKFTPPLYPGQDVVLTAETSPDVTSYFWQSSEFIQNPTEKIISWLSDTTQTFKVNVLNQYKCAASDSLMLEVYCYEGNMYVPSAFTPNGDGKNDYFRPVSPDRSDAVIKKFIVYNNWGQVVYSTYNVPIHDIKGWDGGFASNGNKTVTSNVFVWYLEFICNGALSSKKGTVVLIR